MTEKQQAIADEALDRAQGGMSLSNYGIIIRSFMERGIPEDQILPRENVLTFHAWKAKGRYVKRGEHGVRVTTWIPVKRKDAETGEEKEAKRPWSATVFHVSQTEAM